MKNILTPLLIIITAFLSYNYNFFLVVSDEWFTNHQLDSEQLVLDGLLQGTDEYGWMSLGRYSRPKVNDQYLLSHQLYAEKDKSGTFGRYESQYGLQLYLFNQFSKIGLGNVDTLQTIAALLMSMSVGILFLLVRRDFSEIAAVFFSLVLIFSPWVVVFARNLYWVTPTWFMPLMVAMFFSSSIFQSNVSTIKMMFLIFFAFLIKFLCGYEYLSTIFIASCVPILYQGIKQGYGFKKITIKLLFNSLALIIAFILAIGAHVYSLAAGSGCSISDGFSHVIITAKKRLSSDMSVDVAKAACNGDIDCEKSIADSLSSNALKVAGTYFIFDDFIPWMGVSRHSLSKSERVLFKSAYYDRSLEDLKKALYEIGYYKAILLVINEIAFIFFLGIMSILFNKMASEIKAVLAFSLLAPLSWFFLAKGHSYIHFHMNYVLWYLPFIPYCFISLSTLSTFQIKGNKI